MAYGKRMTFRARDGGKMTLEARSDISFEDAEKYVKEVAGKFGWTPRKWWMFWRWFEER